MKHYALLLLAIFAVSCTGPNKREASLTNPTITLEEYKSKNWQEKVEILSAFQIAPSTLKEHEIILAGLLTQHERVQIEALKITERFSLANNLSYIPPMLKTNSAMLRYHALSALVSFANDDQELKSSGEMLRDPEWMIREIALRNIRNFPSERSKKIYFSRILLMLKEKNINVLREVYDTLIWYQDPRAYTYLIKRSYVYEDPMEIIVIMDQLIKIPDPRAKQRIQSISRTDKDPIVVREARFLLGYK